MWPPVSWLLAAILLVCQARPEATINTTSWKGPQRRYDLYEDYDQLATDAAPPAYYHVYHRTPPAQSEGYPPLLSSPLPQRQVEPHYALSSDNEVDLCGEGTRCTFFFTCWLQGGKIGAGCGTLHGCCNSRGARALAAAGGELPQPSRPLIDYGPVRNDPQCGRSATSQPGAGRSDNQFSRRIVGGNDAAFGQFPWQAFIQVGGSRCGGALVGRQHVVTAGHCVAKSRHSPERIRVTLGDYVLFSDIESLPHEVFRIAEVRLHPYFRFTPQADRFDVAVLILDRVVPFRANIRPICLPPKGTSFLGVVGYATGWGATEAGSKYRPKVLQFVPVPVLRNSDCEAWHHQKGIHITIHDEMMCAGYEFGGRDSCQGDSGGPLMIPHRGLWYLAGIVSAGYSCAKHHQPGIYHRVSSSSDWISANLF